MPRKETCAESRADNVARRLFESLLQSGKKRGFAVTQTRTLPFWLRRPEIFTSSVAVGADAATALVSAAAPIAEANIRAAHFVPKSEI